VRLEGAPTLWRIGAKDLQAANRVGQQPQVTIEKMTPSGDGQKLSAAPFSISVFQIPVTQSGR